MSDYKHLRWPAIRFVRRDLQCRTQSDIPPLQFQIRQNGTETVVEVDGRLDSLLTRRQREGVLAAVTENRRLVLDFSRLTAVSSIGLRMLLFLCRHVQALGGSISARGVSEELRDITEATGFSRLFQEPNAADERSWATTTPTVTTAH